MEKEVIESTVGEIPVSQLGEIQQDHEIWEETDGNAHFKVTRHILPVAGGVEMLSMSVSGEPSERARVVDEFCEVFGAPASLDILLEHVDHIDVVAWLVQ